MCGAGADNFSDGLVGVDVQLISKICRDFLDALTETYVAVPLQPGATLAQSGEPRPIVSRTLWQRPKETPARDPAERPEEE